jgi:hypothetical protein
MPYHLGTGGILARIGKASLDNPDLPGSSSSNPGGKGTHGNGTLSPEDTSSADVP